MTAARPASPGSQVTVHLLQFPVDVWARAREHSDALQREFALMADNTGPRPGDGRTVPERLLAIVAALRQQYSSATTKQEELLYAALEARTCVLDDLVYDVPAMAGTASEQLSAMFDEADRYCREGKHLLTLATPEDLVVFRRWFLGEFVRQCSGEPPRPWPEFART